MLLRAADCELRMHNLRKIKFVFVALAVLSVFGQIRTSRAVFAQQQDGLPESAGVELVRSQCLSCHESDLIVQQRLSKTGWTRELEKMIRWGTVVKDADKEPIIEYLTRHFGPRPLRVATVPVSASADAASVDRGRAVFENRCLSCHEIDLTEQQRLTRAGWVREVEKMMRWGAVVNDDEKEPLVEYLFRQYGPRPLKTAK